MTGIYEGDGCNIRADQIAYIEKYDDTEVKILLCGNSKPIYLEFEGIEDRDSTFVYISSLMDCCCQMIEED